ENPCQAERRTDITAHARPGRAPRAGPVDARCRPFARACSAQSHRVEAPMGMLFSFASWNVEQFTNAKSTSGRITRFLLDSGPPDVFGIFEVRGSQVFRDFVSQMPS